MLALSPLLGSPALHLAIGAAAVAAAARRGACCSRAPACASRRFELIASGREELPLPVVESERSRLSDRRYRRQLARTLDVITAAARAEGVVVAGVRRPRGGARRRATSCIEVARLLRELPTVRARGVALVTRLIRDGATSPLYRGPAPRLREELGRIRHVLIEP